MKLVELNYPEKLKTMYGEKAVTDFLKGYNFKQIGTGSLSTVWSHPKLDYVLKIFKKEDNCYQSFIKLVIDHPSIYFPKFRGKMMRLTTEYLAIRMERLTIDDLKNRSLLFKDRLRAYIESTYIDEETLTIFKEFPGLKQSCDLCKRKPKDCIRDLHLYNIMFRGNIPVIIDPWY